MNTEGNNAQLPQSSVSVSVTDLRIGNIIYISWKNAINRSIREVEVGSILDLAANGSGSSFRYEGVSLNEAWFLNFGFIVRYQNEDRNKPLMWKVEGNRHIELYFEKNVKHYVFLINRIQYSIEIKYVHQLQNLYFCLTGSELQISSLTEH